MSDPIVRLNAALEGRYAIERKLGEGGMATVYLADDLKHERKVALKVLKPELAAVVGAERFLAEIKTTANLQHPHILPLHDSGEADSFLFYVMPYVEGETLRDRIDREHQLPVDQAVKITTNVAEALDYAHRQGVIHRDIKPANILMQDGKPVISDFGIALAVGVAGGGQLTETGLSLGTPHYMSPEQATGDQNVGPQTDTYALGCVLHEMLVGEPPYTGPNAQAVLGQIIAGETASVTRKRPSVPANVDAAVRKALEKLPADRFTTAEGLLRALGDHGFRHGVTAGAASVGNGHIWASSGLVALTVLAGAVIGVIASPLVWLRADGSTASVVRFDVTVPDAERVSIQGGTPLSLSPDGAHLVFVGSDGASTSLYIRRLSEREARRIPGTEGATEPFFSPTGEEIGFLAGGTMQRISIDGGAPLPILDLPTGQIVGASWGTDGMIVFTEPAAGLAMVPAEGGEPTVLTQIDRAAGEFDHVFPQITPGGKTVLFTVRLREESTIAALTLETGEWESFRDGSVAVRYLPSGYLLYPEAGALVAQPFDLDRLEATGPSVPVLDSVVTRTSRAVDVALFDVSSTGTLAYVHGRYSESLAWVTGDGTGNPLGSSRAWLLVLQAVTGRPACRGDDSGCRRPGRGSVDLGNWARRTEDASNRCWRQHHPDLDARWRKSDLLVESGR